MGYVFDGVYMTEEEFNSQPKHASSEIGTVRMKDVSGPNGVPDGIIDNNDRVKIGDPNPDFIYGMTNEFSWKNFDLSILISGQVGGTLSIQTTNIPEYRRLFQCIEKSCQSLALSGKSG